MAVLGHHTLALEADHAIELFGGSSAFSAPTHAKVDVAGLLNDLYTTFRGLSKN